MNCRFLYPVYLVMLLSLSPASGKSQVPVFKPLDTMLKAREVYRRGVGGCNESVLDTATQMYLDCRRALEADPLGLGQQYQHFFPKIAYKLGWCYFRRAELTSTGFQVTSLGDTVFLLDTAYMWLNSVDINAPNSLGIYAAYLAGECKLQKAIVTKFRLLCEEGALSPESVRWIEGELSHSKGKFQSVSGELVPADVRAKDVAFEQAKLSLASGDSAGALGFLDGFDYTSIGSSPNSILRYSEAMRLLEKYLMAPDDSGGRVLDGLLSVGDFLNDRHFREAGKNLVDSNYSSAAESFRLSAQEDGIAEAYYWRGFALLILLCSDSETDESVILGRSRQSFEQFIQGLTNTRSDSRRRRLVSGAERKAQILRIALGVPDDEDSFTSLSRDDVKFLIRVAASTQESVRLHCLDALAGFLDLPVYDGQPPADRCITGATAPLSPDEVLFYKGLRTCLRAEQLSGALRREKFAEAANTLDSVVGNYQAEAEYVQARALFEAERYSEADSLLRELVSSYGSVRSLYWLGVNYERLRLESGALNPTDRDTIFGIMKVVNDTINSAGCPPEYERIRISAELTLEDYAGQPFDPESLRIDGIDSLNCPDTLSVDTIGDWQELVFYETLHETKLIKRKFAEECLNELRVYGLPKMSIYPSLTKSCANNSVRSFTGYSAQIPEDVILDSTWTPSLQFVSGTGNAIRDLDSCVAEHRVSGTSHEVLSLSCERDQNGYYTVDSVPIHDTVFIRAYHKDYYTRFYSFSSDEPGFIPIRIALSERLTYSLDSSDSCNASSRCLGDTVGRNIAMYQHVGPEAELPRSLQVDFERLANIRDFDYDGERGKYLVIDCEVGRKLLSYGNDGEKNTVFLTFNNNDSLNSPEGIAVDSEGNIYIADWGHHRVAVFDRNLRFRFAFGKLGRNMKENTGNSARFVFPTRIAIEKDTIGIQFDGEKLYREKHILVADRNGIHKFDTSGHYLGTPIDTTFAQKADTAFGAGSFYAFTILGYGKDSRICVANRANGKLYCFKAQGRRQK